MERPRPIDPKILEAKIKDQQVNNPYFVLFNGERVLRSNILKYAPETMAAIEVLIKDGRIIGEPMLFPQSGIEGDIIYSLVNEGGDNHGRQSRT